MKPEILFMSGMITVASAALYSAEDNTWQQRANSRKNVSKVAEELNDMARGTRVSRKIRDHLETQAQALSYALKQEQITQNEAKKIENIHRNIEKLLAKIQEEGSLSQKEAENLYSNITRGYRLLWFLRRNDKGQQAKISLLGKDITLKDEYQQKLNAGTLSNNEMGKILSVYHRGLRVRDNMQTSNLSKQQSEQLEKYCIRILSECFEVKGK